MARNAACLVFAALAACAGPPPTALPDEYLGRWYYTGSSGGITGRGMNDSATGYIVIRGDNTIEQYTEDGTLTGSAAFTLARGRSIFSTEDRWIVSRGNATPQVITVAEDGRSMWMADNAYDGFGRSYARAR